MENQILILEDDSIDETFLKLLLRNTPVFPHIHFSSSAREALDFLEKAEQMPTVIVTDWFMPEYTGFEFLQMIKSKEKTKNISVVFLTGNESENDRELALANGAKDYFIKPLNYIKYIELINSYAGMEYHV